MKIKLTQRITPFEQTRQNSPDDFRTRLLHQFLQLPAIKFMIHCAFGGNLEPVVLEVDILGSIALPDSEDEIDCFFEHLVAVFVENPECFCIRSQCSRTDAEDQSAI